MSGGLGSSRSSDNSLHYPLGTCDNKRKGYNRGTSFGTHDTQCEPLVKLSTSQQFFFTGFPLKFQFFDSFFTGNFRLFNGDLKETIFVKFLTFEWFSKYVYSIICSKLNAEGIIVGTYHMLIIYVTHYFKSTSFVFYSMYHNDLKESNSMISQP